MATGIQERTAIVERQRLARELHDSVSQALYGISLGINTARTLFDTDRAKVLEALDYALSLTRGGLTEMRALIFELRPESLEMEGLVAALTKQIAALQVRHGIEVELSLCDEPDVPLAVKEAVYRIAQEALHNAVKHAQTDRRRITGVSIGARKALCNRRKRELSLTLRIDRGLIQKYQEGWMTTRVMIADDHSVVRQGLRMFLSSDPELEIIGEARDGAEAVRLARQLQPDVVLMDLLMPVMDGIAATAAIRREMPNTEVVALTSVLEDAAVVDAVRAGAIGYLLKDTESDELRRAIKAAAAGQVQLSPAASSRLLREMRTPEKSVEALTERETEVLRLLAHGQSNQEISRALHIAEQTVKTHVSHILDKLDVASRTQAALYALRNGLASAD